MESDAGGFVPKGFSIDAPDSIINRVQQWKNLFEPYEVFIFSKGQGGADIGPLKSQQVPLFGFRPDSQRYFDFHHTSQDTIENVNPRELSLGAATIAALIYLIYNFGLY